MAEQPWPAQSLGNGTGSWRSVKMAHFFAVWSWEVTDHSLPLFSDDGWTALLALCPVKDWSMFGKSILRRLNGENPARLN